MGTAEDKAKLQASWAPTTPKPEPAPVLQPALGPTAWEPPDIKKLQRELAEGTVTVEVTKPAPTSVPAIPAPKEIAATEQLIAERDRVQALWEQGKATLEELQAASDRVIAA